MFELFSFYLQGGLIDVGFLGAAQIDRFGNINSTVIGEYEHPEDASARLRRGVRDRHQRPPGLRDHAPVQALVRREDRLPDLARQPRRSRDGGPDPARAGLARFGAVGRRDGPGHLPLRRHRRDAPGLDPPRRHAGRRSARRSAGSPRWPSRCRSRPPPPPRSCASSARSWTRRAPTRSRGAASHQDGGSRC